MKSYYDYTDRRVYTKKLKSGYALKLGDSTLGIYPTKEEATKRARKFKAELNKTVSLKSSVGDRQKATGIRRTPTRFTKTHK